MESKKQSPKKKSGVSKGNQFYLFSSNGKKYRAMVEVRGEKAYYHAESRVGKQSIELYKSSLGMLEDSGRIKMRGQMSPQKNGNWSDVEDSKVWVESNPLDGSIDEGNMKKMMKTPARIYPGQCAITYGFYDAGMGEKHQFFYYVTKDFTSWMGDFAKNNHEVKDLPLSTFVLPGAHDAGMCVDISDLFIAAIKAGDFLASEVISALLGRWIRILNALVFAVADTKRGIRNVSVTQKDRPYDQLRLGARWFDFRPGYNVWNPTDKNLYHQHALVPGIAFKEFLADVVRFLKENPTEIVSVGIKYSGMALDSMKPKKEKVYKDIDKALEGSGISRGDETDFHTTYGTLLGENKRLLIVYKPSFTDLYDKYEDNYNTQKPGPVLEVLKLTKEKAKPEKATVFQLQATATLDYIDSALSFVTRSDASSVLLSTKGKMDHGTYNWLQDNMFDGSCMGNSVIFLNDFVDNALTWHAMKATKARFKKALEE